MKEYVVVDNVAGGEKNSNSSIGRLNETKNNLILRNGDVFERIGYCAQFDA